MTLVNLKQAIPTSWYQKSSKLTYLLLPLSGLFMCVAFLRRCFYRWGWLRIHNMPVPVIVVGNISVGGTGKTPLVLYLVKLLQGQGYKPGIVSRGYGGENQLPHLVSADSNAAVYGDEPVLLAQRGACPVVVGRDRVVAAQTLLSQCGVDIIISDDGLQHYRLGRSLEIAVVDGVRRYGNGHCLPAGPLREPVSRLKNVDFIVNNGAGKPGEWSMRFEADEYVNVNDANLRVPLAQWCGKMVHAVAGIGHPERFFKSLTQHGLQVMPHAFADHHAYSRLDVQFADALPVVMTEKDAVKCKQFNNGQLWYLPVTAVLDAQFAKKVLKLIKDRT
jgi:tetraacyldisaccharide 4'-kinase